MYKAGYLQTDTHTHTHALPALLLAEAGSHWQFIFIRTGLLAFSHRLRQRHLCRGTLPVTPVLERNVGGGRCATEAQAEHCRGT